MATAFKIRNLSVLAYANGFTLWHYKDVGNTAQDVSATGFFNDAADMLAVGDMIMVTARDGCRMLAIASTGSIPGDAVETAAFV